MLPATLQARWIGDAPQPLLSFELLGEARVLSGELLTVSVLLGSAVGLYFTGLAITDSAYRTSHFERLLDEVRLLLAARAHYLAAQPVIHERGAQHSMGFFGAGTLLIALGDVASRTADVVWIAQGAFIAGTALVTVGAVALSRERRSKPHIASANRATNRHTRRRKGNPP